MKFLFHGDDQAKSRTALNGEIDKRRNSGIEIIAVDGIKTTVSDLESVLLSSNLFSSECVIIENIFSRPLSSERKNLLKMLKEYVGPKDILVWEKKEITKALLSSAGAKPSDWKVAVFKAPAVIFTFLDAIQPGNTRYARQLLHEASTQVDDAFVFIMLSRHIADLIVAQSGDTSKLIPFKRSRLISQAKMFPNSQLSTLHSHLLSIDRSIKTGTTKLSYLEHLDLLLSSLLN